MAGGFDTQWLDAGHARRLRGWPPDSYYLSLCLCGLTWVDMGCTWLHVKHQYTKVRHATC